MKLPLAYTLLLLGLLSGCNSFRPVTNSSRNPSRSSNTDRVVQRPARTNAPTTAPRPRASARPKPAVGRGPIISNGPSAAVRNILVTDAEGLLGIRYKYGGNTPREGFDCSGFVKYLYNAHGLSIQRVSRDQARQGTPIKTEQARPGDLVFYRRGANQPVFHVSLIVAIAPGEIWVIHPTSSRGVIRENILASSYWKPKIYSVKDMIQ